MLNLSDVIFRIKLALGIANLALPFENPEKLMIDIIQRITIPTFSLYLPDRREDRIEIKGWEVVDKSTAYVEYLIPEMQGPKLLYINDITYRDDNMVNLGYYAGLIPTGSSLGGSFYGQLMMNNLSANLVNLAVPKMTFDYLEPRTLRLYNAYWSNSFIFDWSFEHSPSLNTIPNDALETFMKLACLDIKANLYPSMKLYLNQSTQFGTITLPIENWESAEQDREALLQQWDESYHLDGIPYWYG